MKNYKVSEQTAGLIEAYDMMGGVYQCAYNSLCKVYSEENALNIIEEKLMPGLEALEKSIFSLIALSMKERRGDTNRNEV